MTQRIAPIVKWVGSKKRLVDTLISLLPKHYDTYCEPFVGGGSLLFALEPKKAWINDINQDLMLMYEYIKSDLDKIKAILDKFENTEECFYEVRAWDRDENYKSRPAIERVARLLYLNRTCYNGLYRVNSKGYFNAPFGFYKNPKLLNMENAQLVSEYLKNNDVKITSLDFSDVISNVKKDSFVYLDPPYLRLEKKNSFTSYDINGFNIDDHNALFECCKYLDQKGIKFMLSNSMTNDVLKIFSCFSITEVKTKRIIASNVNSRGEISEVVIRNYL